MRRILAVVAAWLPILGLWLLISTMGGATSFADAFPRAALTVGIAAILGIPVWNFCLRAPWPEQLDVRFYALHVAAAVLYSVVWMVATIACEPLITSKPMWSVLRTPRAIGWAATGVWLYAVIAGVSYAIQTQRRALQAEARLASARLDALQQRLHPHFLFNALHTVSALVRRNPAEAEGAIEKLGDMLRYSLEEQNGNRVPFAEEWEFTQRYLEFEQLRYGERLRVEASIDDESMTCSAPLFALQTLVENAVHHSIAMRPEGGRIEITARADEKQLFVQVRDDGWRTGNPACPDRQDCLSSTRTQFGLQALRERLQATYGAQSKLAIESDANGYSVSFVVPRSGAADAD